MMALRRTVILWVVSSSLLQGCVVSTVGGPGTPPDVPLPQKDVSDPEPAPTGPTHIGARHILISYQGATRAAPYVKRSKAEARALAQKLRARADAGEDVGELAKEHSDDRGSASGGGDLGEFRRDQMVEQFSRAAFSLEVGEVSEVVETPFGFHVIQRTQ